MARKRKRKKRSREESLQVDLLQEQEQEQEQESESESETESQPEPSAPDTRGARRSGERWAKAFGQLEPASGREAPRPDGHRRPGDPPQETRGGPGADSDRGGAHASARDHAAVPVRPAGEPLARARELVEQGHVHRAIELYLGILTVNPANLKAHNNLGVLYDELKQFEAALEHFEAAERLAPENVEVLANYASTLTSLARYDEAEELLKRAQRFGPEDVQARLGMAILYFRRGLYQQAETELGWVCARAERNGTAFYYRGEALNRLHRYDEGAEALERAIELIPNDPRPFYTLGHLYDRRNRLEDAAEMYRRARLLQRT